MRSSQPSPRDQARLLMEAVAELHSRGYGRLKLFCYIKEGLGAWRHFLFAGSSFPNRTSELPEPVLSGSLPGWPAASGETAKLVANAIEAGNQELIDAARGDDFIYTSWYRELLLEHPTGVLEMESPEEARMNGTAIETPYALRKRSREP